MDMFATSHFSDDGLRHDLKKRAARDHSDTAVLLTRIAEFDQRKLFLREGYPSMHAYCVRELHYSEGETYRRINAARTVRQFPGVLVALAEGRLHLRAVLMLARHLTFGNADELVAAATHKTKEEIQHVLARRFPRPDLPERLQAIPAAMPLAVPTELVPEPRVELAPEQALATMSEQAVHRPVEACGLESASQPATPEPPAVRSRMAPLAPQRFGLQVTLDQETYDLLQQARALMSHQNPTGEIVAVIRRALQLLVGELEKRKFAATTRPGHARTSADPRHIPARVKHEVWERDRGQCTFVSETGRRCGSCRGVEFDHEVPVARGGAATVENLRLRCRAHNQYEAECAFGVDLMNQKRREACRRRSLRHSSRVRDAATGEPL